MNLQDLLTDPKRLDTNRVYEDRFLLVSEDVHAFLALVAQSLDLSGALLSFLNTTHETVVAAYGTEPFKVDAQHSFCAQTLLKGTVQEVLNPGKKSKYQGNPLFLGQWYQGMVTGVPLANKKGQWIGTLTLLRGEAKKLTAKQKGLLRLFSDELARKLESGVKSRGPKSSVKRLLEKQFAKLSYYQAAIINGTDYAVIYTGTQGLIKTFNAGATNMLGYSEEEVVDQLSPTVFHLQNELQSRRQTLIRDGFREPTGDFDTLVAKASTGQSDVNDWTYVRKDGTSLIVQLSVNAIFNEQKNIIGYLAIAEDITQRKKIQEELRLSEEKHRLFFENSQGLMCTHDDHGRFLSINTAGASLIGYTPEEMMGLSLYDVTPANLKGRVDKYLSTILDFGSATGLMKIIHKDGSVKVWFFKNIRIHEGPKSYIIGNAIDVSSRVELEKNLKLAKILAEKNALAKDQFLANMSHEIRTPMNAIVGFTDILFNTSLSAEQLEYLSAIRTASENLLGIINDILDFSKIESGKLQLERVPFNIREAARSVHDILALKAREKSLKFTLDIDPALPEVLSGDRLRLNQILFNLVGNAIKFTETGYVTLRLKTLLDKPDHCEIAFEVEDSGIGIPPEKLEAVFDRFNQASSDTTRKYGGTGLGLSISKSLVAMQGGTLTVESEPGKGSKFSVVLPFDIPVAHPIYKAPSGKMSGTLPLPALHILLVEDNDLNQKLAKKVLGDFGFKVTVASNGLLAVDFLQQQDVDLVLMDLQMPEMDGYQATRAIRKHLHQSVPIIAMTAHSLVGENEKCLAEGMNDYMAKPFKPEDLYHKIYTAYTASQQPQPGASSTPDSTSQSGHINLSALQELSGGNKDFEKEIMTLTISILNEESLKLMKALEEQDPASIRQIAHKLKSNMALFKLAQLVEQLEALELIRGFGPTVEQDTKAVLSGFAEVAHQLKNFQL